MNEVYIEVNITKNGNNYMATTFGISFQLYFRYVPKSYVLTGKIMWDCKSQTFSFDVKIIHLTEA